MHHSQMILTDKGRRNLEINEYFRRFEQGLEPIPTLIHSTYAAFDPKRVETIREEIEGKMLPRFKFKYIVSVYGGYNFDVGLRELIVDSKTSAQIDTKACIKGNEAKLKRLKVIVQRTSTPEGQREHIIAIESLSTEIECKITYLNIHDKAKTLDKVISELKDEGKLPRQYRTNYSDITKVLRREIANQEMLRHMMRQMPNVILCDKDKRREEILKAIKDVIASSFDFKKFEAEQKIASKTYDWESLEYE